MHDMSDRDLTAETREEQTKPVPRRLRRREALGAAFGGITAGAAGVYGLRAGGEATGRGPLPPGVEDAQAASSELTVADCVLSPEQTEGPYYVAGEPTRRDITEDRRGTPLILDLKLIDAGSCSPLKGASVEVWHADAAGEYSGFGSETEENFLRGGQRTDRKGGVRFTTIYPGWYTGRTTHIHVKVHVSGSTVYTGQFYFPDRVSAQVYGKGAYAARGEKDMANSEDGIYASELRMSMRDRRDGRRGFVGRLTLGVET